MEPMEAISEGEWSSLSDIYTTEEAHFMAQLLGNAPLNTHLGSSPGSDSGSFPAQDSMTLSFMGTGDSSFYPSSSFPHPGVFFSSPSGSEIDYLNLETGNDSVLIGSDFVGEHNFLNPDPAERNVVAEEKEANEKNSSLEMSGKRSRSAGNRMKMNVKLRKGQSLEFLGLNEEYANANHDQKTNAQVYKRSSSTCCSGDDSGVPQGQNGGSGSGTQDRTALRLSGKMRASRGSATDPQSLYARKRRERINERLKILQSLVPNGTKVDISTMLEEAVHYVKFLQLQIKLLSSDDLWMYAPIAYNGIDIGLDLKINPPR